MKANPGEEMTIKEASIWASREYGREISDQNISYLIQYGRVPVAREGKRNLVRRADLEDYYREHLEARPQALKAKLGNDLNWDLSFDHLREKDTTRHVHRLHPYKGKFIPQLAAYFLDEHVDRFKTVARFAPGDVVLDPFAGSGTTLVQAAELGLHAIGVDISGFNAQITGCKIGTFDLDSLQVELESLTCEMERDYAARGARALDRKLDLALKGFNVEHFPSPAYKRAIALGEVDEEIAGPTGLAEFISAFGVGEMTRLRQGAAAAAAHPYMAAWFAPSIRCEIDNLLARIRVAPADLRPLLEIVLTRAMRSARSTTHFDLGTLKEPITEPYYCFKHKKICRPLLSLQRAWRRYARDTVERLREFGALRRPSLQHCLVGDSRTIDLTARLSAEAPALAAIVARQGIKGIFSSPPYVGVIDYHEQHAYAYEALGLARRDAEEIGPLFKGTNQAARRAYVEGIARVLANFAPHLTPDHAVFLVANDRHDLYPEIARQAGMEIKETFKRPVLNRSERDSAAYAETIFMMRLLT